MTKFLRISKMSGVFFLSTLAVLLLGSLVYFVYQQFGAIVVTLGLLFGACILGAIMAEELY